MGDIDVYDSIIGASFQTTQPIVWLDAEHSPDGNARTIPAGTSVRVLHLERNVGDTRDRVTLQIVDQRVAIERKVPEVAIGCWSSELFY